MFVEFLYELRRRRVPVGTQEAVALSRALAAGLHESSLDGFYHVARAVLIHSETHLDDFDVVFASFFRGVHLEAKAIAQELLDWRPLVSVEEGLERLAAAFATAASERPR